MAEHIATYTAKQASQLINSSVSTIRKYSLLLEGLGYRISATNRTHESSMTLIFSHFGD